MSPLRSSKSSVKDKDELETEAYQREASIGRAGRAVGAKSLYSAPPGMAQSSQLVFMLGEHVIRL